MNFNNNDDDDLIELNSDIFNKSSSPFNLNKKMEKNREIKGTYFKKEL